MYILTFFFLALPKESDDFILLVPHSGVQQFPNIVQVFAILRPASERVPSTRNQDCIVTHFIRAAVWRYWTNPVRPRCTPCGIAAARQTEVFLHATLCKRQRSPTLAALKKLCLSLIVFWINQRNEVDLAFDLPVVPILAVSFFCSPNTLVTSLKRRETQKFPLSFKNFFIHAKSWY